MGGVKAEVGVSRERPLRRGPIWSATQRQDADTAQYSEISMARRPGGR